MRMGRTPVTIWAKIIWMPSTRPWIAEQKADDSCNRSEDECAPNMSWNAKVRLKRNDVLQVLMEGCFVLQKYLLCWAIVEFFTSILKLPWCSGDSF